MTPALQLLDEPYWLTCVDLCCLLTFRTGLRIRTLVSNLGRSPQLYDIWTTLDTQLKEHHHSGTCQIHSSWKYKMATAAILTFEKCLSPGNNCKMAFSLHVQPTCCRER